MESNILQILSLFPLMCVSCYLITRIVFFKMIKDKEKYKQNIEAFLIFLSGVVFTSLYFLGRI